MAKVSETYLQSRIDTILRAATRVFARKGLAETTMRDVATEAGLSVGAIYRYFPGKEELLRAVFGDIREKTRSLFEQTSGGSDSALETLLNAGHIVQERLKDESAREQTILMLEGILVDARRSGELLSGQRQLRTAYIALTERLFRQAQAQGRLNPDVDPGGIALLMLACMVGVHVLALESADVVEMDPLLDVITEMLRRFAPPNLE